jgi:hypothetical protein
MSPGNNVKTIEEANTVIENAVGELYRGFYLLRQAGQIQDEYSQMDTLMSMLMKDRDYIRKKYKVI